MNHENGPLTTKKKAPRENVLSKQQAFLCLIEINHDLIETQMAVGFFLPKIPTLHGR